MYDSPQSLQVASKLDSFKSIDMSLNITNYPIMRTVTYRNVYSINLRFGTLPGLNVNMALSMQTENTLLTSTNCTDEFGCANGVFG